MAIEVADTGCGIPESNIEKIFEPFFTTRKDVGGTGLGLALVQKVMTAHEGQVEVQSGPLGGAQFTMTFPRAPVLPHRAGSAAVGSRVA